MVHPDYQYDHGLLPELIRPITEEKADVVLGARILAGNVLKGGIPVPARYFPEASTAGFFASLLYGMSILLLVVKYLLHQSRIITCKQFNNLSSRYRYTEA